MILKQVFVFGNGGTTDYISHQTSEGEDILNRQHPAAEFNLQDLVSLGSAEWETRRIGNATG